MGFEGVKYTKPPDNSLFGETKKKAKAFRKKNKPVMYSGGNVSYKGYTKF